MVQSRAKKRGPPDFRRSRRRLAQSSRYRRPISGYRLVLSDVFQPLERGPDLLADLGYVETTLLKPDSKILSGRLDPAARQDLELWMRGAGLPIDE